VFILLDTTNTTTSSNATTANTTNTTTANATNTTNTTTTNATNATTTTPVAVGPTYTYPYKITLKGSIDAGFEIKAVLGDINYEKYLKIDTTSSEIVLPCGAANGYYNPFFSN